MFAIENGSLVIANGLTYIAILMFVAGGLMFLQRTTKWKIFDIVPPLVWIYVLHMILCTLGIYAHRSVSRNIDTANLVFGILQYEHPVTLHIKPFRHIDHTEIVVGGTSRNR